MTILWQLDTQPPESWQTLMQRAADAAVKTEGVQPRQRRCLPAPGRKPYSCGRNHQGRHRH